MADILSDHNAIREWASAHAGAPALVRTPQTGSPILRLVFGQRPINADGGEGPDPLTGLELVSWQEWFEELDNQGLALRIAEAPDHNEAAFEFVMRPGS